MRVLFRKAYFESGVNLANTLNNIHLIIFVLISIELADQLKV